MGKAGIGRGVAAVLAFVLVLGAGWTALQADGGPAHRVELLRPIALGVSGGSIDDRDGGFCCGGTLGGLVVDTAGNRYVLSNNHVLGRTNRATAGEDTIQPGLIDSQCVGDTADAVADFSELIPISFNSANTVDAAIARARDGMVDPDGAVLDIGTPSADITEPVVGMDVQKSGRTTGHTTGVVTAIDVTVNVSYPKKCGAGGGKAALMVDQFMIGGSGFSAGGDSGSVIFEQGPSPRAVGLLFAGSSTSTIANRMSNVLGASWSVGPLAMAGGTAGCTTDADCDDADACTTDTCNADGTCSRVPLVCDDGDACTTDTCDGGACVSSPVSCDDGDACTTDGCDAATGCFSDPMPGCADPCGDGTCDIAAGEDCRTCPDDCAGKTRGKKSERFCCGDDVGCTDGRCTSGGACVEGAVAETSSAGAAGLARAREVKQRNAQRLLTIPGAVGHGIGHDATGAAVIEVYFARARAADAAPLPPKIDGVRVRRRVTGRFTAF